MACPDESAIRERACRGTSSFCRESGLDVELTELAPDDRWVHGSRTVSAGHGGRNWRDLERCGGARPGQTGASVSRASRPLTRSRTVQRMVRPVSRYAARSGHGTVGRRRASPARFRPIPFGSKDRPTVDIDSVPARTSKRLTPRGAREGDDKVGVANPVAPCLNLLGCFHPVLSKGYAECVPDRACRAVNFRPVPDTSRWHENSRA